MDGLKFINSLFKKLLDEFGDAYRHSFDYGPLGWWTALAMRYQSLACSIG
jgi:hypothetical protein